MTTTSDDARAVRELMEHALLDVTGPPHPEQAALTGGRRARRRRRWMAAGTGAFTAAALLTAGWGLGQLTPREVAIDLPIAGQQTSTGAPAAKGWWRMPAGEMLDALQRRLPDNLRITGYELTNIDKAPGEPTRELRGYLVVTVTGDDGSGQVNIVLYAPAHDSTEGTDQSQPTSGEPSNDDRLSCSGAAWSVVPDDCATTDSPDGTPRTLSYRNTEAGVTTVGARVRTNDGGLILVDAANSTQPKFTAPASAPQPPLTTEQLLELAQDPIWTSWSPGQ